MQVEKKGPFQDQVERMKALNAIAETAIEAQEQTNEGFPYTIVHSPVNTAYINFVNALLTAATTGTELLRALAEAKHPNHHVNHVKHV